VTHVPFETLIDYVRGLGAAETREPVRQHLSCCPRCADEAAHLSRLAAIARADAPIDPPDEVVGAAIALFNAPTATERPSDLARLVFDSATESVTSALDDAAVGRARILRFEADGGNIDVELMVTEHRVRVSVAGQITARTTGDPLDGAVSAHRKSGQRAIARARSNDGEFRLDYDGPADALLHFIIAGAPAPIDVIVTAEIAG
jgi:hypothetical protein